MASEWGTPLAPIHGVVAEAFKSPFGEAASQVIGGWERDLNELGNALFRLCTACEAAADEEEAIANVVAGGFPPPARYQDLAAAFALWEGRPRLRRPVQTSPGGAGGYMAVSSPGRTPPGPGTPGSGTGKPPPTSSQPTLRARSGSSTVTPNWRAAGCSLTTDKGGTAAQAGLDEMLLAPPVGLEKDADDALEHTLSCAAAHDFAPEGKRALANLLTRPGTIQAVARQLAGGREGEPPAAAGFKVASDVLQGVLSDLMVNGDSRRTLLDGANRFAADRLKFFLEAPDAPGRSKALRDCGALFGGLASRSYSVDAALDVHKMAADAAKDILGAVRGTVLDVAKAQPVISLAVESGAAILFDVGQASADQERLARELEMQESAATAHARLRADLSAHLDHLTYVSVLTDATERGALDLQLSPADLPAAVPPELNLSASSREEWVRDLFDDQGRLVVPQPSDPRRWSSFLGWTEAVNPKLMDRVSQLTDPMGQAFEKAMRT